MEPCYVDCSDGLVFHAGSLALSLEPPRLEIDGKTVIAGPPEADCETPGEGRRFRFVLTEAADLVAEVRQYPGFVRLRYCLGGRGARLTKTGGRDNFRYTGFALGRGTRITEVQVNQYAGGARHAYLPQIVERPEVEWLDSVSFPGPIVIAAMGSHSLLCAYEHGGEYTDDFLVFRVDRGQEGLTLHLECGDGTYCNGAFFSDGELYDTPWFQIGFCNGDTESMLRQYRNFLLRDMPDSRASREPYIFYNTWNNQERNRAFRGRKYLEDMNTGQMLKEIELAHRIGIDVFVIDTGWYKSTGDWEVDLNRFPDDMEEIRSLLDRYGMRLGLWFNPSAAAVSSDISRSHPEYRKQLDGKDVNIGPVWETEESFNMCLVSDYASWFIEKLVTIGERYGVSYFKWDAVDMRGCTAPHHRHGGSEVSPEEREKNFRFRCGMALTHIAAEVSRRLPGAIVDLDVTEGRRYVGLGFLRAGKFFHMNNGPYYHDFDIPGARDTYRENWNVFFYPGVARNHLCRQSLAYDGIIPSVLFLTHFLPDGPSWARQNALASLYLGGNGIWGDLHSLKPEEIEELARGITAYKKVRQDVTIAYPKVTGFIGASPEIHEKLNPETGRGLVVFFTREPIETDYCTRVLNREAVVEGADQWERLPNGRYRLRLSLKQNEARSVFFNAD